MSNFVAPKKGVTLSIVANDELAVYSKGSYQVIQTLIGYPNLPSSKKVLFDGSGSYTSSAFSAAATVVITNGADAPLYYATGTGPVVLESVGNVDNAQGAPATLNATGTLTLALISSLIVTSTTAAAVTATLDTGANFDAALDSAAVNDAFVWSAINTGGTNAFTVAAGTGHTLVGNGAVAANASGRFLSRRTAAQTWVTYRLS